MLGCKGLRKRSAIVNSANVAEELNKNWLELKTREVGSGLVMNYILYANRSELPSFSLCRYYYAVYYLLRSPTERLEHATLQNFVPAVFSLNESPSVNGIIADREV